MDISDALIRYRGSIDDQVITKAKASLQGQLSISDKLFNKMFAVFVELAQNISRHSSENNLFGEDQEDNGVGFIRVYEDGGAYHLHAANWILRKDAQPLVEKCDQLNKMSHRELRKMKQDIFSEPTAVDQKGGKVGLIQVALRAKNPIKTEIEDKGDTDLVYFNILTSINIKE